MWIYLKKRLHRFSPQKQPFGVIIKHSWEMTLKEFILQWSLVNEWILEARNFTH